MDNRRSALWLIFYQIIMIFSGIFQSAIVSRALGPSGRGIFYFNLTLIGVISLFGILGVPTANIYFIGKKNFPRDDLLISTFWYGIFSGFLVVLVYFVCSQLYGQEVVQSLSWVERFIFAGLAFLTIQEALLPNFLQAEEKYFKKTLTSLLPTGIYLFLIVPLFFLNVLNFQWILFLTFFSKILSIGLTLWFLLPWRFSLPNQKILLQLVRFGTLPFLANLFQALIYRVDTFFLGAMRPSADLGYYSISQTLAESLFLSLGGLGVLLPLQTRRKENEQHYLTTLICRTHVSLVLLGAILLGSFSSLVIKILFSDQFLPARFALLILLPGCVLAVIPKILSTEFGARGRYDICLKVSVVSCLMNLILNYPLIFQFGVFGAALSTTISYGIGAILQIFYYKRLTNVSISSLFFPSLTDFKILFSFKKTN